MTAEKDRFGTAAIKQTQVDRIRRLLEEIIPANAFWTKKYADAGVDVAAIQTLDDFRKLPLTTKQELVDDQGRQPPYGTNMTYERTAYTRMHQTSGTTGRPLRWLDTPGNWQWVLESWEQIYRLVGVTKEDRFFFPFSFGPFVGFWAAFEGAQRIGRLCLAGGGMGSETRLQMIEDHEATIVCCTPSYALRLAEAAEELGFDLKNCSVRGFIVAGEPGGSIPATRQRIEEAWNARVFDHWGMTEVGPLGNECVENPGGLHLLETECIAEIVDSDTGELVEPGELGELIITTLGRTGTPLIRYRTGDLVREDTNPCPCGRELMRLDRGILGRSDDMVTIRGNNVFPSSLEAIIREFDEVAEFRITVRRVRSMQELTVEIEPDASLAGSPDEQQLVASVRRAIKARLNFYAEVVAVPSGALPRFDLKGRRFFREDDA